MKRRPASRKPPGLGEMHVIRTDVLLHCLAGFAEVEPAQSFGKGIFTESNIALMRKYDRLYRRPSGKLEHGKLIELAGHLRRGRATVAVTMHNMRKVGALPPLKRAT